jgi:nicotinate phosphoribosyltransferase
MTDTLGTLYGSSLALLTDLYQLTMGYGYWKSGVAEREAAFHLFFRRNPFQGGYAVACGLQTIMEYVRGVAFTGSDLEYLASLRGNDGRPLFEQAFLDYLGAMRFGCDVDAMPEGTVVFAHEPMVRITGPIIQCQLLETALLNLCNFATLIATKAGRVCQAARGEPVLEFGLRRAQGVDGGITASRAAYVGGCAATSNVLAGKLFGIPVKGTHAHSWVMFFDDELEAFSTYADAMPNNCVFLVDTYDTLEGVRRAIEVGKALRARGHEMAGVRLDSGDLAHLSIEARKLLDDAGFASAAIVASNDLDEHIIKSLKEQGATIGVWGVGTKLATAHDQPALGGVYKLSAVRGPDGHWQHKIKLSEQSIKISNPGLLQVRRFVREGQFLADLIYDEATGITEERRLHDIEDPLQVREVGAYDAQSDLLVPVFRGGVQVYEPPDIHAVRDHARAQLDQLDARTRRFLNPQIYPVGLEHALHERKLALIAQARAHSGRPV